MEYLRVITDLDLTVVMTWLAPVVTLFLSVSAFVEKRFGKNFIGTMFFRHGWRGLKFCANWAIMPWKDQITEARKRLLPGAEFNEHLQFIRKEMTLNGGKSLKDLVTKLETRDGEKWQLITDIRDQLYIQSLRLDINDESVNRMTFRLNKDLRCFYISQNFLRHFGYVEADMLGLNWDFCIAKKERTQVRRGWKSAVDRQARYGAEQTMIDSDGKEYQCYVRGLPVFGQFGELNGFYGTVEILEEE